MQVRPFVNAILITARSTFVSMPGAKKKLAYLFGLPLAIALLVRSDGEVGSSDSAERKSVSPKSRTDFRSSPFYA